MKKLIVYTLCLTLVLSQKILSQERNPLDTMMKKLLQDTSVINLRQNFAVPDLPAFNALNTEPSNLLRPSTPKDFVIVASNFYSGNNVTLPKSIALEVSPLTIAKSNKLTLRDYQRCPALYNLRVSIGTLRDSLNVSKIGFGIRTTLIDKSDIKYKGNLSCIYSMLEKRSDERTNYIKMHLNNAARIEEESDSLGKVFDSVLNKNLNDTINSYVESRSRRLWNAEKWDIAIAFVGASPDSLAKNIKYSSFSFWSTLALPVNKNGQFLVGAYFNNYKLNNKTFNTISIPIRLYFGTNELKGYIESQYSYKQFDKTNNLLASLGCEYKLTGVIWAQFIAGINKDFTNNTSNFTSSFRLIYTLPGKI